MENALVPVELRSRDDVRRYTATMAARKVADDIRVRVWRVAKRVTFTLVLAAAVLIYYMLSIMVRTMTLPHMEFPALHIAVNSVPKHFGSPH